MQSLVARHRDPVNLADLDQEDRLSRSTGKVETLCVIDPDATMATRTAGRQLLPSCKQHALADGRVGIFVDIEVVTRDGRDLAWRTGRVDTLEATLGRRPGRVTADTAYGKVCKALSDRDIQAAIPP